MIRYFLIPIAIICSSFYAFAATPNRTSVILISVDTLRADHLTCYGYHRIDTKNIDDLARGGTVFTAISSQVPLTLPSHVSLLTSTYPFSNGVEDNGEVLKAHTVTLARVLRSHGYRTAAFIGGFVLARRFGLAQGFDYYNAPFGLQRQSGINIFDLKRPGGEVMHSAINWLNKNSSKPFFMFLHFFDLHTPYTHHRGINGTGYDAEIEYVDRTLGQFWSYLSKKGLFDKTLIVFLADHGQGLGEHGEQTHGFFIYQSTLHVPLIIHWPKDSPRYSARVTEPAGLIAVAPTILQFLHIPAPPQFQGKSLMGLLSNAEPHNPRKIYSESLYAHNHFDCAPLRSIRIGNYKYIEAPKPEFYDLATDPHELHNLYNQDRDLALAYKERLLSFMSRFSIVHQRTPEGISPEIVERLASLGYVAVSSSHPEISDSGIDPKDMLVPYQKTNRAIALAYAGRTTEAVSLLEKVLTRYPQLSDTRTILGLYDLKLGRNTPAADNFKDVLKEDPTSILAHYNLGRCYIRLNRLPKAIKEFRAVMAIGSSSPAYKQVTIPTQEMLGVILLRLKDYEHARTQFDKLLLVDPQDYIAHYNLAWLDALGGKLEESKRQLRLALAAKPKSPEANNALGKIYLEEHKLNAARLAFEKALQSNPQFPIAHYNLGVVLSEQGMKTVAEEQFKEALQEAPQFNAARKALQHLHESDQ